ncbi:GLE1-like protein-domain-containing protein [Mycotypha africana]|uniref:GLE1-like protein-domain-containing protein n=1 Tax=Mycotypha africana TaxID=64632 RepID=UPI0023010FE1|nr:GLE1-like protein-domain-containing protein [Mycotypha africana]KAI8967045.1 GLE1-like protein-domain-containing protein [Mycotypha africana]
MTLIITNPNIYSVPDSDSEDEQNFFIQNRVHMTEKQQKNILKLGCTYNPLDKYKSTNLLKGLTYIEPTEDSWLQYQLKLQERQTKFLEKEREKRRKEHDEAQRLLEEINLLKLNDDNAGEDDRFEKELEKQRKLVENAIQLDKKKLENEKKEAQLKEEKAKKEKEEEAKRLEEEKKANEKKEEIKKLQQSSATSIEGWQEYQRFYKKIEYYKTTIKPKLSDDNFRKACFNAKRPITRTVSQLQYDHSVLLEKHAALCQHLAGIKQQSPDAFEFALNHLAKAFLSQARQEIHATAHAAYFLARFAYLMISSIPEFSDYLLGRLFKRCQYLIPKYHDDDPSLSVEEIKARLRYTYSDKETKTIESHLQHSEFQKCYIMLYGALCQTVPDPGQPPNPYPLKHAWIWLARICNMPPREVTPALVGGMLEVASKRLLEAYPTQMTKLLKLIRQEICPKYPPTQSNDNVANIRRVEMFIDDYFQTGKLDTVPEVPPEKR